MNQKLIEFIKKHLKKGIEIQKIKHFLINSGYELKIVEEHIEYAINSSRHKKYLSTITIILAVLSISAIGFYLFSPNKKTDLKFNGKTNAKIEYHQDIGLFNEALIANDTSICNSISDKQLKHECEIQFLFNTYNETNKKFCDALCINKNFLDKALIKRDISSCSNITDVSIKKECQRILNQSK